SPSPRKFAIARSYRVVSKACLTAGRPARPAGGPARQSGKEITMNMMCMMGSPMDCGYGHMAPGKIPLLLMGLAAGYAVLVLSQNQQRPLDFLGRILGAIIILVSVGGLLCSLIFGLWCRHSYYHNDGVCAYSMKNMSGCPHDKMEAPSSDEKPLESQKE